VAPRLQMGMDLDLMRMSYEYRISYMSVSYPTGGTSPDMSVNYRVPLYNAIAMEM
jgi:hypothetical protein